MLDAPHRAKTTDELAAFAQRFQTEESSRRGLAFQPRPSDVFISPFSKCGTTWTQQIVHGLRTRGDMSFDEITAVTPWLEMAYDLGLDLDAPQPWPRVYKSHCTWDEIPKGGRYIVPIRDPRQALVSLYHFMQNWWFEAGTISIDRFARAFFLSDRGYWQHLASWWPHRNDDNVLLLCYENMLADTPQAIRTIAGFIGIELDEELLEIVVRQSSLAFMSAHERQFDDHLVDNARSPVMGIPLGGESSKVTDVLAGRPRVILSAEILDELDRVWQEEIETKFGLPTYDALRLALREANP